MNERHHAALAAAALLLVTLACKGKTDEATAATSATAAATTAPPSATTEAPVPSASAAASASAKPTASAATAKPSAACHGLMLDKRCARECTGDDQCPDPKERCAIYSGPDDDGQNVMGAMVCQYDADNEPRKAAQTVGVPTPKKGADCPDGWAPSVDKEDRCDKECTTDAQCGPGNKCKAVGPIGSGKQCQKA